MSKEERVRRAFRILFYNQDKIRNEIRELNRKLEKLEKRISNLLRIGDN